MTTLPDNGYDLLHLDQTGDYIASCPCAIVELPEGIYEMHCWRVCFQCKGCGLHYKGDRATAEAMKVLLDEMDWYGEWNIVEGLRR